MAEPNAFFDGFEGLNTTTGTRLQDAGWWLSNISGGVTYPNGRYSGNKGISLNSGGSNCFTVAGRPFEDGARHDYFAMAAAFKLSQLRVDTGVGGTPTPLTDLGMYPFAVYYDPNVNYSTHIGTRINTDGSVSVVLRTGLTHSGVTEIARTRANVILPNNWHYMSWRGRVHPSSGESTLVIDGETMTEATLTGTNTRYGSNLNPLGVMLGCQGVGSALDSIAASEHIFDDFVMNSSGVLIPERRIDPLLVNADGGTLNLTPSTGSSHFGVVDEAAADLTDYLSGTTVGDLDLMGLQNMTYTPTVIDGVRVKAVLSKTDANTRAWVLGIKSAAVTAGAEDQYVSTNPAWYDEFYWVDPNTSVAWIKAGVDALEVRPRISI